MAAQGTDNKQTFNGQYPLIKEKGTLRLAGIDQSVILGLLEKKHRGDVFVAECKNGETWGARDLQRLDVWVLLRTYSPLTTIGYEIKCTRQDFEQDQKWTGYLDLCHVFYFVCPAGMIRATDLPSRVGIIWASKNALHTKRKAERVEPDTTKLQRLLIYILMSRSQIVANMNEIGRLPEANPVDAKHKAVIEAEERKELAYFVQGHIRKVSEELNSKEASLSHRESSVKDFERRLAFLGITWDSDKNAWQDNARVGNEIDLLKQHLDWATLETIKRLNQNLTGLLKTIEAYRMEGR